MKLTRSLSQPFNVSLLHLVIIAFGVFLFASHPGVAAARGTEQSEPAGAPDDVFVHTALGGFILGYDIDPVGNEGLLAEALTLPDGRHDVAVETFNQKTGEIIKIISQETDSKNDFVVLGVVGRSVGLVEHEIVKGSFVSQRRYSSLNPLDSNRITGKWTPPLTTSDIITAVGKNFGAVTTAFLGFGSSGGDSSFLFSSNVGANTFGPLFALDSTFMPFNSPVMALDSKTQQAVVAALGPNAFGPPNLAKIDLGTGATSEFTGVGIGYVNGIAVDPDTGIACTTTEIDFSVEFYDLASETGFAVPLPGAVSQAQSGAAVAFDPIHQLFLVGQPMSSTAASGSSIQVFDELGNFIESVNGLTLPASPVTIALHPKLRFGYVLVTPDLNSLQSFSY
jgi:hypothetical protein